MSERPLLHQIESPDQISGLSIEELVWLAEELRGEIVAVVSSIGGHLGASLGVVELTVALHHCFDSPRDKLVWDVGHQAYGHKILTGRRERFPTIRQYQGLSGFPKLSESPHDMFGVGHASTAISAALGYCVARDLRKERHHVCAIVGDGALTGGVAYEGLNNAGHEDTNLIVILNDNDMSISPNVGALSRYLTQITSGHLYNRLESEVWSLLGRLPLGDKAQDLAHRVKESLKTFIVPGQFFEALGFRYFGPLDGHDLPLLVDTLEDVKRLKGPVLIHLITEKGKGYSFAEADRLRYHGVNKFDPQHGVKSQPSVGPPSYTDVFGDTLTRLAEEDRRIVAITAAMSEGTGLVGFSKAHPDRFFDVGIAEQHAVTFAGGLACRGLKPVAAIYSTFLQRAYDQLIHDIALQKLNVVFALDRAGLVGADGPTHHGAFDLAYLRCIPNLVVMAPMDENELQHMVKTATSYDDGPIVLRYPRGNGRGIEMDTELQVLPIGKGTVLQRGEELLLVGLGAGAALAEDCAKLLGETGITPTVINARFLRPLDEELLLEEIVRHRVVCTIEEGTIRGGFGSALLELAHERLETPPRMHIFGIPDEFIEHGSPAELQRLIGLHPEQLAESIRRFMLGREQRIDLAAHRRARGEI
ncbi:MAG TPA: 1-deoxy-D-xylulose-5-phosphate synthase [Candidatus Krumholzibacteria bacterium]|jgi:1-deoxy-D-xylulose-5-phosphate synthase